MNNELNVRVSDDLWAALLDVVKAADYAAEEVGSWYFSGAECRTAMENLRKLDPELVAIAVGARRCT